MILPAASPALEEQITESGICPSDADELRKFAAYLAIEAVRRTEADPAGLLTTLQTVIYPDLHGENER